MYIVIIIIILWSIFTQDLTPRSTTSAPTPVEFDIEIIIYVGLAIAIIGLLLAIITYLAVRYVY